MPPDIGSLRTSYPEMSQPEFARLLGVSLRGYQALEAGRGKPKPLQEAILRELTALDERGDLREFKSKLTELFQERYPTEHKGHTFRPRIEYHGEARANNLRDGTRAALKMLFEDPPSLFDV